MITVLGVWTFLRTGDSAGAVTFTSGQEPTRTAELRGLPYASAHENGDARTK